MTSFLRTHPFSTSYVIVCMMVSVLLGLHPW